MGRIWFYYGYVLFYSSRIAKKNIDTEQLKREIHLIFDFIKNSFSLYEKHSNINLINQNQTISISQKEVYVYQLAQEICNKTNAYFFPFKKEMIFIAKKNQIPLKNLCNSYSILKNNENKFQVKKTYQWLQFDLNAIAKGFTVDLIKNFLESKKLNRYLIEFAGEICVGDPPTNQFGWKVAFEYPTYDVFQKKIHSVKDLKNLCLAASGNYLQDHIFNPYQAKALKEKNKMIIVFGPSCTIADAYATYIYVQPNYKLYSKDYSVIIIK